MLPIRFRYIQFVGLVEETDTSIFRWKSRHVDFSLEKPTRWFFVEKADTSIFGPKSGHIDFSWKRAQFGPEFKLLLFELRSNDTGKSSGSFCTLFICVFWYHFFNYTFIILIFFNREKNSVPMCPLFQRKIDVSAFWTKNRRVGCSNEKLTCRLFPLGRPVVVKKIRFEKKVKKMLTSNISKIYGSILLPKELSRLVYKISKTLQKISKRLSQFCSSYATTKKSLFL